MYEVSDDAIDLKHGEDKTIVGRRDAEHRTTLNFISTSLSLERAVQICGNVYQRFLIRTYNYIIYSLSHLYT